MQQRWTAFAHGRTPDAADAPAWPKYCAGSPAPRRDDATAGAADSTADAVGARATLVIERRDTVVADLDGDLRTAWGDRVLDFR